MKMRSSRESTGSCMLAFQRMVEKRGQNVPEPHRDETDDDRADHVAARAQPVAVTYEVQGLQTERGKRRVAAANAKHEKAPRLAAGEPTAIGAGKCRQKANGEAAGDVHPKGAPGKRLAIMN